MSDWFTKEGEEPTQPLSQSQLPGHSPEEHIQDAARAMDAIQAKYAQNARQIEAEFARHADEAQGIPPSEPQWPE